MCSPRPGASYDMRHDMVRSNHTSFDSSRRGEHDGAIIFALTLKTTELLAKENLGKFWHFWPLGAKILTWEENHLSKFCSSLDGLSNAVYRMSLRCLVFEILGGGAEINPPGRSCFARTTRRARVDTPASRAQMWTCSNLTFDLILTCHVTSIFKFQECFRSVSVSPFQRRLARPATPIGEGDNQGAESAPPPSGARSAKYPVGRLLTRALMGLGIFHALIGGCLNTPPHDLGSYWS